LDCIISGTGLIGKGSLKDNLALGVFKRGVSPSLLIPSPSPLKERGIKGVRLINNF